MKRRIVIAVLAIMFGGLNFVAADERDQLRKELEARFATLSEAYKKKDIRMFMEDKTPDFTVKTSDGKVVTRDEVEAAVKKRMEQIKKLNYIKLSIEDIQLKGNEAEVITTQEFSRIVPDAEGKEHLVVSSGTTHRETWIKTPEGWKVKHVEETKQGKVSVDGKTVQ